MAEVRFKLSEREKDLVDEVARSLGITRATLVRVSVLEYLRSLSVLTNSIDKTRLRQRGTSRTGAGGEAGGDRYGWRR